ADWRPLPAADAAWPEHALAGAVTGKDGAFAVDVALVPPGPHVLLVTAPGRPPLLLDGEAVAFGAAALPQALALELPPPCTLEGMVLDDAGAPAASVAVGVVVIADGLSSHAAARTDSSGRFRFEGLPALGRAA